MDCKFYSSYFLEMIVLGQVASGSRIIFIQLASPRISSSRESGDLVRECTYSMSMASRYQKRITGPLLDRIDIHVAEPIAISFAFLTI